ncbi:MAG: prepilin peptidase [Candidatus Pacearchaeota archaeon]
MGFIGSFNSFNLIIYVIIATYLLIAAVIDIKKREVPDWLSFSLLFITLSYVAIKALTDALSFDFIFATAIAFLLAFLIANCLYYARVWGGGDYKLFLALSPALTSFFSSFILNGLLIACIYGLFAALYIFFKKRKKIAKKMAREISKVSFAGLTFLSLLIAGILLGASLIHESMLAAALGIIFVFFPLLYLIIKFADREMIALKTPQELVEGDLLDGELRIERRLIKGILGKEEIRLIKKAGKAVKTVRIKEGIPFVPVFLLAFLLGKFNLMLAMVYALL